MSLPPDSTSPSELEPRLGPETTGDLDVASGPELTEGRAEIAVAPPVELPQHWAERSDLATLPRHVEAALKNFLGSPEEAESYKDLSPEQRREEISRRIAASSAPAAEAEPTPVEPDAALERAQQAGLILDQLFDRAVAEMAASRLSTAEGWTDNLAWTNRVVGSLRTLGLGRVWGDSTGRAINTLKIGSLVGAGYGTSLLIRSGEHLAGSGGVVGGALGALGYQQMYQRNLDNRWQRGQHVAVTVASRLTRPVRFLTTKVSEEDRAAAEEAYEPVPEEQKGLLAGAKRVWRSLRVASQARHLAKERRAGAEEANVHLRPEQVAELDKPALLQRLAEGRLALTRQDRREQNWRNHKTNSIQRQRDLDLYAALVRRAAVECSPEEVERAIGRTATWSKVHLAASLGAGALGAAAGFFGGRWLSEQIRGEQAAPPAHHAAPAPKELPPVKAGGVATEDGPTPFSSAWVEQRAQTALDWRTASAEPSALELSQASHAVRANILRNLGVGEYRGDKFILTGEHHFANAAGDGWVKVQVNGETVTLPIAGGKTDLSPLLGKGVITQGQLQEVQNAITQNRLGSLQHEVTGRNLVREYTGGANSHLIERAEQLKNELLRGLVDRPESGQLQLSESVHNEFAAAGYDFNVSDVHSLSDAHREVHQAMSRWFAQQAAPKLSLARPALPTPAPGRLAPAVDNSHWSSPSALERRVFAPREAVVSPRPTGVESVPQPVRAVPNISGSGSRGVLDTVASSGTAHRPYEGWRGPWEQARTNPGHLAEVPATRPTAALDPAVTPVSKGPHLSLPDQTPRPVPHPVVSEAAGPRVQMSEPQPPVAHQVAAPRLSETGVHTTRVEAAPVVEMRSVPPRPQDAAPALAEPNPAPRAHRVEVSKPTGNQNLEDMISGSHLERITEEDLEEVAASQGKSN